MIKQNQRFLNAILVLIDICVVIVSILLSHYIRFKTTLFGPIGGSLPFISCFDHFYIIPKN